LNLHKGHFHLNKWFLDFIGNSGEAMIFYAAELTWRNFKVPYTSYLYYDSTEGISRKSRTRNIQMPEKRNNIIRWSDSKFEVEGTWKEITKPLQARLFESEEGFLDWNCFQPASEVHLIKNDIMLEGKGYVEQLILTFPPWNIPMNELRWGRFGSAENQLVWIELRGDYDQQWLWWNGIRINNCTIDNHCIIIPEENSTLKLDQGIVLESEKKISTVVKSLLDYIPGFNKVIPTNFLMAQEFKWLSRCQLITDGKRIATGMAIHEMVNFKSHNS